MIPSEKSINVEGKLIISSHSSIDPDSGDKAKGIFIYNSQYGNLTDIDDLDDCSFLVILANTEELLEGAVNRIDEHSKIMSSGTMIRKPYLGVACSYISPTILTSAQNENQSSLISSYATSVKNNTSLLNFPPVLHIEHSRITDETIPGLEYNVNEQLNLLKKITGKTPIVHTSYKIAEKYLTDPVFTKFPLWLTDLRNHHSTDLPGAWKQGHWSFLETIKYVVDGQENNCHPIVVYGTNKFHGNIKELDRFVQGVTSKNQILREYTDPDSTT